MLKNKNNEKSRRYSSYYSSKGDYATTRVAQAIKGKSWRWTLLNLAWTAGPVTMIAIFIGHRFGFGNGPSSSQLIYFTSYTLVVGIFAGAASLIREVFYQPKIEAEKKQLLESVDRLFTLTLHIRDRYLSTLPIHERKIMAAYYTLQSAGISNSAVKKAVYDLTSNKKLSEAIERVSALNEQGMQSLIDDIWTLYEDDLEYVRQSLKDTAPETIQLLIRRMKGDAPHAKTGRSRDVGFIQRTLDAADENDSDLMTLSDAYEISTLLFELINGRQINILEIRFSGDRRIAKKKRRLDVFRKKYRHALRLRNSSIRLTLNEIDAEGLTHHLPKNAQSGPTLIRALIEELESLPQKERQKFHTQYENIRSFQEKAVQLAQELLLAKQNYTDSIHQYGKKLSLSINEPDLKRAGFYINENTIRLDDQMKLYLAHRIDKIVTSDFQNSSEEGIKDISMELATELDGLINIGHKDIQAAIEGSNAIQLGYLKPSYTPATKVGWARRIVQSMHQDKRKASHQIAINLMNFYEVKLTDPVIELLESEFGADKDYLLSLKETKLQSNQKHSLPIPQMKDIPAWQELNKS